jgi:predicted dehydrogenase
MTLSVGLLSTAHVHVERYADILADHDGVTLAGVTDSALEGVDDGPGRDTREVDLRGVDRVSDPDELLNDVDAAVVCSRNVDKRGWFERAAAADVAVLCEKPFAPTVADAEEMVETWRETGIVAGVAMPLRFCAPVRRARESLESDDIGDILSVSGTNRGSMPGGWFADPNGAGGGAVMEHTVHIVDLVANLLEEWPAEVYAELETRMHDIEVEDVAVLSMELGDGTPFLLDSSWSRPDVRQTRGDAGLELLGQDGTISIDCLGQPVAHTSDPEPGAGVETYCVRARTRLVDDFVTAVREGRDPAATPPDGLRAIRVIEAAYESAEAGKPIDVQS